MDGDPCKHAWAVLRHAHTTDMLAPLLHTSHPIREVMSWIDDGEDGCYDDDIQEDTPEEDTLDEAALAYGRPVYGRPIRGNGRTASLAGPTPGKRFSWKETLHAVHQHIQALPATTAPTVWPADRRLVYVIDVATGSSITGVTVELNTEKQRRDGTARGRDEGLRAAFRSILAEG